MVFQSGDSKKPWVACINSLPSNPAVNSFFKYTLKSCSPATGLALILMSSGMASAATFHVSNTNDAGPGSLRQAVDSANTNSEADEIVFDASVSGTVNLTSGPLEPSDSLTVSGPGSENLTIDAGGTSEIFLVTDKADGDRFEFSVSGLTLANATTAISADANFSAVKTTVKDCKITGSVNSGIFARSNYSRGTLDVSDTLVTASGQYGIFVSGSRYTSPSVALERVTITNNGRSGVSGVVAGLDIRESTISGNSSGVELETTNYADTHSDVTDSVITGNLGNGLVLTDLTFVKVDNSNISSNGGAGVFGERRFVHINLPMGAEIRNSTVADNNAGGVMFTGVSRTDLLLENSTISGNRNGYGVGQNGFNYNDGSLISNSTITGNEAGGVYTSEVLPIIDSIVAGNNAAGGVDLSGPGLFIVDHTLIENPGAANIDETVAGSNIIGMDPLLGSLQNNGGLTPTHALLDNSPAIDQGDNATCLSEDQRGVARPQDGDGNATAVCDMGAFERTASTAGTGVIGDRVWRDIDGDGAQDANEPGLHGVVVNLRVNCDAENLLSTVTDSNGAYRFDGLPIGTYRLEFVQPAGYSFSPSIAAGDYRNDSNADPATGLDRCRSLKDGQARLALDAGLVPSLEDGTGLIGDYVWRDDNGDGVQDSTEPGLEGVNVKLQVDCNPAIWLSTTTDKNGAYSFDRLPPSSYQLQFFAPLGYSFSPAIAAGDYTRDSNANSTTGQDKCRSLPAGRKRTALDAGLVPNPRK